MSAPAAARLLANCFGLGRLRPAPGTIGSAFGLAVYWVLWRGQPGAVQIGAIAAVTALGVAAATSTAKQLGDDDPSEVVIDEVAGMWLSLFACTSVTQAVVAFFVFRALDIIKPFPARQLEALPGGWGIMLDDLAAGAYTLLLLRGLIAAGWLA